MRHAVSGTEPSGSYSPGVLATGRLLFVSGQGPLVGGQVVPGTVAEQTRVTLRNLEAVLNAGGADLGDVVRCGVYLADMGTFAEMDAAYREFFGDVPPARTTVGAELAGIGVEIDCVAAVDHP